MAERTLYIGDKNLSSWSLRAWLVLKHFDIPFTEELIRLDRPETRAELKEKTGAGLVPCLKDGDLLVWDSLAIAEYAAELHPERNLWPADRAARAVARSVCAEMHSGFQDLRLIWPMHMKAERLGVPMDHRVRRNVARIDEIWADCRARFGERATGDAAGPYLFGAFSIADAVYAPVVSRFRTYGPVALSPKAAAYAEAVWETPALRDWVAGALAETAR